MLLYFIMFGFNFRVQELFQNEKRVPRNTNFAITDSWYVHNKAILAKILVKKKFEICFCTIIICLQF